VYQVPLGKAFSLSTSVFSCKLLFHQCSIPIYEHHLGLLLGCNLKGLFYSTPKTSPCLFSNKINVGIIILFRCYGFKGFKTCSLCSSNVSIKFIQFYDCFQLIFCTFLDNNLIFLLIILYRMWSYTYHEHLYVIYSFFTLHGFLFLTSFFHILNFLSLLLHRYPKQFFTT
jgi:hypothetical protein